MVEENTNAVWVRSADALPSLFKTPVPSPLIGILLAWIGCMQSTLPAKWIWNLATGVCAIVAVEDSSPATSTTPQTHIWLSFSSILMVFSPSPTWGQPTLGLN